MTDWIKHDGKGMPVDGETIVDVKYRDGSTWTKAASDAHCAEHPDYSDWVWPPTEDDEFDIIAYRVHKPSSEVSA